MRVAPLAVAVALLLHGAPAGGSHNSYPVHHHHCCPGIHLRIAVPPRSLPPWFAYNAKRAGNERWSGFIPDLGSALAAHMGGRVTLVPYSGYDEPRSMREGLMNSTFNLAVESLTQLSFDMRQSLDVSYTTPFFQYWHGALSMLEEVAPTGWGLFDPFSIDLWVAIIVAVPVVGMVVWVCEAFPLEATAEWRDADNDFPRRPGFLLHSWQYSYELLLSGGCSWAGTRTWPGRLALSGGAFLALVVVATYTANLASILTLQTSRLRVRDLSSLKLSDACHPGGEPHPGLQHYVKNLQLPPPLAAETAEVAHCMHQLTSGAVPAVVGPWPLLAHARANSPNCSFMGLAPAEFAATNVVFATAREEDGQDAGSEDLDDIPLGDLVSGGLIGLQETDKLAELETKWFGASGCAASGGSAAPVITYKEMEGMFVLCGAVTGFAFLLRLLEYPVHKMLKGSSVAPQSETERPMSRERRGSKTWVRRSSGDEQPTSPDAGALR
eukprot:TRINITY_DN70522_c0_g1_i1.p1 TRINITY_DN70522_c0_g1~~TRINITY_DN70522_c0_g1_i1.p1  ORF type:complete len:525 (+),score=100.00 TRINITY_DN70522_c0_g1_i1:88-1575(+)